MAFRDRRPLSSEREALLSAGDPHYKLRRSFLSTISWKSITLGVVAGLVPLLLWMAIFQSYESPHLWRTTNAVNDLSHRAPPFPNLEIPRNSENSSSVKSVREELPTLMSILSSPNWRKLTAANAPTEFGASPYPHPRFHKFGNKTIANYHLIVTKGVSSPDGFPQPAILVNGQSPGPEIRVKQFSILTVIVENKLDTPLAIHFHGLHQRNSFLMDGVPHVTQNPIPPGGTFKYRMNLFNQTGNYFYHAHTGVDSVWLFGPLIIEDDPSIYSKFPQEYQYEEDRVFIFSGVYHEELDSLVDRIVGPIHSYPTLICSVAVNGRSFGEWANNITGEVFSAPTACGYDITPVKQGVTYRFRLINAASDSFLSCNISSHKFRVIEMDGIYTHPVETDHFVISPGQRYSLIITMDQEDDNYYIACKHMESQGPLNGLAVLNYFNASKPTKDMLTFYRNGSAALESDRWVVDKLVPNHRLNQTDVYQVPPKLDREHVLEAFEAIWGQRHVFLLNGHYYQEPEVPYFQQLKNGVNITDIPQVFELVEGEVVQFVFQIILSDGGCVAHSRKNGHHVHVVGEGPNKYDPIVDGARIQRDIDSGKQFQFRDSVTVYANQTVGERVDGAYCGWTAVRFTAQNNGLWLAHCHVTPHMLMGKKFVIWEHSKEDPMLAELMKAEDDY